MPSCPSLGQQFDFEEVESRVKLLEKFVPVTIVSMAYINRKIWILTWWKMKSEWNALREGYLV